jgi:hypothetical protein
VTALLVGGAGVAFALGVGGAAYFSMELVDRARERRRRYVPGEVVKVGCRRYVVASVAADGEPTLRQVAAESAVGYLDPL